MGTIDHAPLMFLRAFIGAGAIAPVSCQAPTWNVMHLFLSPGH
jgi:hypothetical protein